MHGTICYDGSCTTSTHRGLRKAVWAVVEVSEDGRVIAPVSGPGWASLPQTPQAAEYVADAPLLSVPVGQLG